MRNPSDVARKWASRLGASGEAIKQGVQNVTVNPAERAAAAQDRYIAGVQRAVAEGKYQRGLRRVTLQAWQESMLQKGLPRIASGASAAIPKMEAFLSKWLPWEEQLKQKLAAMPRGDLQQNIARMIAAVEHNASFRMS